MANQLLHRNRRMGVLLAAMLVLSSVLAYAQPPTFPMADQVPADAVVYAGWAGADALGPMYAKSSLGAFIGQSNFPQIAREYAPKLWEQLAGKVDDKQSLETTQKILPLLWRHAAAIYLSDVSVRADGTPDANLAMVCDAGADATELKSDLDLLIGGNENLTVAIHGSLITVVAREPGSGAVLNAGGKPVMLADSSVFRATMKSLQSSPALAIYIDGKTLLQTADESASKDPQASQIWPKMRDALGLTDFKSYAMTAGFDDSNWASASVLEAPAPRTGLLAAIEPKPIDPAMLARVPAKAGSVSVINLDLPLLYDTIGNALSASKQLDTYFHQATGIATIALGRPFRRQTLASMGPQWVVYSDAASHSVVMLNHPTDPDQASDSLAAATFGLVGIANSQIAATQPVLTADQRTVKKIDLTSAVTKYASPTFAVHDGLLYFGLSADSVINSATMASVAGPKDILHSPNFLAAMKMLGVVKFDSFDYCDIPDTAPAAYDNFGVAGQQVRQVAALFSVDVPKIELPPLDQLKTHLSPALSVSWSDANAVYTKSISPFPFSTYLLGDPQQSLVGVTSASLITGALVPFLDKQRATMRRTQNMSNERQICKAVMMYATEHKGVLPSDLGQCITYIGGGKAIRIFLLPDSRITVPAEILNGNKDVQAVWVKDHSEYRFLLPDKKLTTIRNPANAAIIAPIDAESESAHVAIGFADGHAETCTPERVKQLLHPDDAPQNP